MSSYQCYFVIHITFPEAPRVKEFYPMTRESVVVSKVKEKKKVSSMWRWADVSRCQRLADKALHAEWHLVVNHCWVLSV